MTRGTTIRAREPEKQPYASHEDFHAIFNEELEGLYQLSFLLTRDPTKAERCLVGGLEDCVTGNPVFHEWARCWAKRNILQNAIRELKPKPKRVNPPVAGAKFPGVDGPWRGPAGGFELYAVLRLEDFKRFVFIMSVLERYSEHDCALLLGSSIREIREARVGALKDLIEKSTT